MRESGLKRSDVWLTTKIGSSEHGKKETPAALKSSNERLGSDFAPWDLVLLHDPMAGASRRLAAWQALEDAKKNGLVRSIGVSNYGVKHLQELKKAGRQTPDINQASRL